MIFVVLGPPKSGKSFVANAIRTSAILAKRGALIVDENQAEVELGPMLEKLMVGDPPKDGKGPAIDNLPWKPDPMIVVVGEAKSFLDRVEKILPGFSKKFGPITTLTTAK